MTRRNVTRGKRGGFTLLEIMVVITIIAVLAGLVVAGVMVFGGRGVQTQARAEIGEMETAFGNARMTFNNPSFMPSRLELHEQMADYVNNQNIVDQTTFNRTKLFLTTAFGKRIFPNAGNTNYVDWNGDGNNPNQPQIWTLVGPECLVFYLGGIPAQGTPACLGFSTNPTNPAAVQSGTVKGPFYTFPGARLVRGTDAFGNSVSFLRFIDPYSTNQPYAYFSSNQSGNDYNFGNPASPDAPFGVNMNPYLNSINLNVPQFVNPKGFQIICAGKDGQFGAGWNTWTPAAGYSNKGDPGYDDQANFASGLLGTPQ